ncbi:MAG: hypothetical protein K1X50_06675, partial [Candidatus Promineofilum sp.]|nr:hypothetical protein [Promineifilum sp.]
MNRKLKFASLVILSIVCSLTSVFAQTSLIERLFPGSSTAFARWLPAGPLATKTWDGGGATNNWSEAANWSGDIVPAPTDDVIFDATSTKNATLDTSVTVRSITIGAGYSGTLAKGASAITIQSNGFGAFTQRGGTFDGGTGDITLT